MLPSYPRASALLGRPSILSFWDHVSKAEVADIREARILHGMLSEDWEQADRAVLEKGDIDTNPPLEPYRKDCLQQCGRIRYQDFDTTMRILLHLKETRSSTSASPHAPIQHGWRKPRAILQCTSGNAAPPTTPYIMARPVDKHISQCWLSRHLLWENWSLPAAIAVASHMYRDLHFRLA